MVGVEINKSIKSNLIGKNLLPGVEWSNAKMVFTKLKKTLSKPFKVTCISGENSLKFTRLSTSISIFGTKNCGKTAIARFVSAKTSPDGFKNGADLYTVSLVTKADDGVTCHHELSLQDASWSLISKFPGMFHSVVSSSDCVLLVCSLSDHKSFEQMLGIWRHMNSTLEQKLPVVVIANKMDIAPMDEKEIKRRFAFYRHLSALDLPVIEVSVKDNQCFNDCWRLVLSEIEKTQNVRNTEVHPITVFSQQD